MRKRNKNKPNHTGRNPTSRFARLDHRLLNSPAYRSLSVAARALLVELTMLDNGDNNGSLYLSIRDAAGRLGMADLSAVRSAFDELQELGFAEMTEDASFHVKAAGEVPCPMLAVDLAGRSGSQGAVNGLRRTPAATGHQGPQADGTRIAHPEGISEGPRYRPIAGIGFRHAGLKLKELPVIPVLETDTQKVENGRFQPIGIVSESHAHIAATIGSY